MNWIFSFFKRNKLNQNKSLDFKMWLETETIVSAAAETVQVFAATVNEKVKALRAELHQLKVRIVETTTLTDPWGNKTPLKQPAFTAEEIKKYQGRKRVLGIVIFFFIAAEIVLYYMISEGLAPNTGFVGVFSLSVIFALFVLYIYNEWLNQYYIFNEAKYKYANNIINQKQYRKARFDLILGSIGLAFATSFLLFAGFGRMYLIEGTNSAVSASNLGNNLLAETILKGGEMVSIMAMIFTFGMAIILAFLKKKYSEATLRLAAYKAWKKNIEKQEKIIQEISTAKTSIKNKIDREIEISHQLALDLMRIYRLDVDPKNEELYESFLKERSQSGFKVTEDVFNRYQNICAVDSRLLSYTINNRIGILNALETVDDDSIVIKTSLDDMYKGLEAPQEDKTEDLNEDEEKAMENQINEILNN